MKTNLDYVQLVECLNTVSAKFGNNISFNTLEERGKLIQFTLKAKSGLEGSRNAASGRTIPKASWEVHGLLFEEMLKCGNDIYIYSAYTGRIDNNGGNWQEIKQGSHMNPCYMSELSN